MSSQFEIGDDYVVTSVELASWASMSTQQVANYATSGVFKKVSTGKFFLKPSLRSLIEHQRTQRSPSLDEKRRLTRAQADMAEQKAAEQRGGLLDKLRVIALLSNWTRAVQVAMLAVVSRIGARLPHLTSHDLSEIDLEVRAALTELGTEILPNVNDSPSEEAA